MVFVRVDVLTPVHAGYARFIPHAWESLRAQSHPDWTWLVQIDGPAAEVFDALARCGAAGDGRVSAAAHGTWGGPAIARNIALGRGQAPLVQSLDADDELEPDTLAQLGGALRDNPGVGFAVGRARDLLDNGELRDQEPSVAAGVLPRGSLVQAWRTEPDAYRVPVHPAGVMWRRSLLLAVGGWLALYGMEDTGLLMAASAAAPGILLDTPTLRYRQHPAQRSRQDSNFVGGGGAGCACSGSGRRVAGRQFLDTPP